MLTPPDWAGLEAKRNRLLGLAGPFYLTEELLSRFHADLIYVSSNLEGISVSYEDAAVIAGGDDGSIDLSRKPLQQAAGQKRVLDLIEREVNGSPSLEQVALVKRFHFELMRDVDPEEAGQYRTEHRVITGSRVMTTMPGVIAADLSNTAEVVVNRLEAQLSPFPIEEIVRLAAFAHHEVTRIHPFGDGNGRVARLYMNYICRLCGLPYILIPKVGVEDIMSDALKRADLGDLEPAVNLYGNLLEDSFDRLIVHLA